MKTLDSGADYVRYTLGELEVVALRDGYVDMPPSRLRQPGNRPFASDLPAQVEVVDGRLRLSVNAFLVVDGDRHILIDTGAANAWEPTMGSLLRALEEAGSRAPTSGPLRSPTRTKTTSMVWWPLMGLMPSRTSIGCLFRKRRLRCSTGK